MKTKLLFAFILACFSASGLSAGRPVVTASLDSSKMLMGNVATLHLEVVQDKNVRGEFPLFRQFAEREFVTVLGDTVELSRNMKVDTAEVGAGRIKIDYRVPVQVFDSGMYKLPEFVYVCGVDTARSKQLSLQILPVKVKADEAISPMTEVSEPEDPSIFDSLPDWLYYYWWLILLLLAIIGVAIWLFIRYRTKGVILPRKPETPPYELAMSRLRRLKEKNLWQTGREKEFYTILTDILRNYLDGRFGIKAMEMTSRQIMEQLAKDPSMRESRQMMRQILDMADFVKFAMVRPLPDDNVQAYDNAVAFVDATKPVKIQDAVKSVGSEATAVKENIDSKHHFRIAKRKQKQNKLRKEGER